MTEQLSEYELAQLAEEARRAKVWAEAEAKVAAEQRETERANSVSKMSPAEFARYKSEQFRKTELRVAEKETGAE
jgi:hypothetical protein